jgi:hypothetical protein
VRQRDVYAFAFIEASADKKSLRSDVRHLTPGVERDCALKDNCHCCEIRHFGPSIAVIGEQVTSDGEANAFPFVIVWYPQRRWQVRDCFFQLGLQFWE